MVIDEKSLKRGKLFYIFEAALEYLISILVAGSFLAKLTSELGMSDSLTGILSSVISLGCLFQLLSVTVNRAKMKPLVIVLSIINQLLFMFLYVIPVIPMNSQAKIVIFIICIFSAYLIYYFAHPKKINWLMSLVDDKHRGSFTANKEIVSLIAGMTFSFLMGSLIDSFTLKGEMKIALILTALVIFVLMVMHTLTMIFTVEKEMFHSEKKPIKQTISELVKNKDILKVTVIFAFYHIANHIAVPFYGTYQIHELGLSLKFVSALAIVNSITRISVSKFWGKYADKKSFAAMIEKCFIFLGLSYTMAMFAVPSTGKIMFIMYFAFHGIALGGINSALINLVFDYVEPEKRADSLAICQAVAGVFGFVTTLAASPFVTMIQQNGNKIFGMTIYAQQILSFVSIIVVIIAVVYVHFVLIKGKKRD